jgi:peptidoglycan hydrolase CwlO-like protein
MAPSSYTPNRRQQDDLKRLRQEHAEVSEEYERRKNEICDTSRFLDFTDNDAQRLLRRMKRLEASIAILKAKLKL